MAPPAVEIHGDHGISGTVPRFQNQFVIGRTPIIELSCRDERQLSVRGMRGGGEIQFGEQQRPKHLVVADDGRVPV